MKRTIPIILTLSFVFISFFSFSQRLNDEKAQLFATYLQNFDRLNQPEECFKNLKGIKKSFRKKAGKQVLIASHRGDHMQAPENSILAFKHAVDNGTNIVEFDIRNSSDDSLMIIHDGTINRTTFGTGKVEEMTYAQLRSFPLVNDYTQELTDSRMPTLYEALSALKGELMIDLDIKCDKIGEIYATVEQLKMFDQTIFFCDEADMDYVLGKNPKAYVMPRARSMEELEHLLRKYSPKIVHIDDSNFDIPEAVKLIRSIEPKCRIWANTLGKRDIMAINGNDAGIWKLKELGIDVIQTDLPRHLSHLFCEE